MTTLTSPAEEALVSSDPEALEQLIARVLRGAHRTMEATGSPDEARAILHVARSFADELSTLNPRFDRVQFIKDATDDPSRVG
jgi:hypothetical protein